MEEFMKKEICLWTTFTKSYYEVVSAFSVQLVDAVHAKVEVLLWMDTASEADVDLSKRFLDRNLLEKSTYFNLEKSEACYYFVKYIYLLVAVLFIEGRDTKTVLVLYLLLKQRDMALQLFNCGFICVQEGGL